MRMADALLGGFATIGSLINSGHVGLSAVCEACGQEARFPFAALNVRPEDEVGDAALRLQCPVCGHQVRTLSEIRPWKDRPRP